MKKFYLITTEQEIRKYYYVVDADNLEDAKDKIIRGDVECDFGEFMFGEIISIEEDEE
jgi:hypothetical protein